jgi:hypothetical protein
MKVWEVFNLASIVIQNMPEAVWLTPELDKWKEILEMQNTIFE